MPTTPRHGLTTPLLVDIDNVPQWVLTLATALDQKMMGFSQGTFAARPAAGGVGGKLYWATDTLTLYQTDSAGTAWRQITASRTPPTLRGYNNASQQATGSFPTPTGTAMRVNWDSIPAPGSGSVQSWQRNGFNTSGPAIYTPAPGIYRIRGQLRHAHLSTVRYQQENYAVWVYRHLANGNPGALLAFAQLTDEAFNAMGGFPSVPFSVAAMFDHSDGDNQAFEVWTASSYPPPIAPVGQYQYLNPGPDQTFCESELVCAI